MYKTVIDTTCLTNTGPYNFKLRRWFSNMNGRPTITEVADMVGVTPRTIMRWERRGKVSKAKRDWRGWRIYDGEDIEELINYHDAIMH